MILPVIRSMYELMSYNRSTVHPIDNDEHREFMMRKEKNNESAKFKKRRDNLSKLVNDQNDRAA